MQIFFLFFALPSLGVRLSPTATAIIALGINGGAYAIEIIRGGVQSIAGGQWEAGLALGLHRFQVFRLIVIKPALAGDLPGADRPIHPAHVDDEHLFLGVCLRTDLDGAAHRVRHVPQLRGLFHHHADVSVHLLGDDDDVRRNRAALPFVSGALMSQGFGLGEFLFLLRGLGWSVLLSLIAFAGGGAVGLAVALLRTSPRAALRRATQIYIGIFQGTPLLLQLFCVYYGLGLVGIQLPAWASVAIGFTLNASAFLGDIWRGAIEALPRGQSEAAVALGLHYVDRMRHVVLPQAFRIAQPATVGYAVQLIKGTSLAAIVGFIELTRAGQIVSNSTFQPVLVFGVVGAIYFALCWPLSLYSARLEARFARAGAR